MSIIVVPERRKPYTIVNIMDKTNVAKHLDMLGRRAKDRVTGFKGVVASLYFDLYGCVQAVITPEVDKDGKKMDSGVFDVSRIMVSGDPVMDRPNWEFGQAAEGKHGPAEKPELALPDVDSAGNAVESGRKYNATLSIGNQLIGEQLVVG